MHFFCTVKITYRCIRHNPQSVGTVVDAAYIVSRLNIYLTKLTYVIAESTAVYLAGISTVIYDSRKSRMCKYGCDLAYTQIFTVIICNNSRTFYAENSSVSCIAVYNITRIRRKSYYLLIIKLRIVE